MNKSAEILLYLFKREFLNLRNEYEKENEIVFDERYGKEQAVEDCERIIQKVLTGKDR